MIARSDPFLSTCLYISFHILHSFKMKTGRILIALFMLIFFGPAFIQAQDDPPVYGGIDITAASNVLLWLTEGSNLYGGGSLGAGANNQGWSVCAGADAVYYPKVDADASSFVSYGVSTHYNYTNQGGPDEFGENFDNFEIGPNVAMNWILLPQVVFFTQLQALAGIGKNTRIEPISRNRLVDNTSHLGLGVNAGLTFFLNEGNSQLNVQTNVASLVRSTRTNADNPDQSFSSTNAGLTANKANTVQIGYRFKF